MSYIPDYIVPIPPVLRWIEAGPNEAFGILVRHLEGEKNLRNQVALLLVTGTDNDLAEFQDWARGVFEDCDEGVMEAVKPGTLARLYWYGDGSPGAMNPKGVAKFLEETAKAKGVVA